MSATPARTIAKVESYTNPSGAKRCKVTLESGEVVALHSLSRVELFKAVKLAFPATSGKAWFKLSNEAIQDAIRSEQVPEGLPEVGSKAAPKAPTAQAPEPGPEGPQDAERAFLDALKALKGGVDPEQVRAIVDEAVVKAFTERRVVRVEVSSEWGRKDLPEQHHPLLPELVTIVGSARVPNVLLVGPAGSGKSTLAEQVAAAVTTEDHPDGLPSAAVSFGPTTPTSKVFGYKDANGNTVRTPAWEVYENGGVLILDELDNGHPGLVAELNQALSNGYGAFAGGIVPRHRDCFVIATANTYGNGPDRLFVGRNILDKATLNRFITVDVDYDEDLERNLALAQAPAELADKVNAWVDTVQRIRKQVFAHGLPLVASPRSSIEGAKLLRAGLTAKRVLEIALVAGWSQEHRDKVGAK